MGGYRILLNIMRAKDALARDTLQTTYFMAEGRCV